MDDGAGIAARRAVQSFRPDLIAGPTKTWDEVMALAADGKVQVPLRNPHSLMVFYTLAANLGTPCATGGPGDLIGAAEGRRVFDMMAALFARIDPAALAMDPIAVEEAMSEAGSRIACVPLTYGYVSYALDGFRPKRLGFADIPAAGDGGPRGSAVGGTGIAVSAYAKDREAFGRKIIENQSIAFDLANMRMEIDASRLLVWRAAWMGRNNVPFTAGEGSMSKLKASEVSVWATERAIHILGGAGYTREHPVERMHRDAKIFTIFEGTSEIQRLVVSRMISGMQIK